MYSSKIILEGNKFNRQPLRTGTITLCDIIKGARRETDDDGLFHFSRNHQPARNKVQVWLDVVDEVNTSNIFSPCGKVAATECVVLWHIACHRLASVQSLITIETQAGC